MTDDAATASPASTALVLTPPQPVAAVEPAQAEQAVTIDPAAAQKIDAMVSGFVDQVAGMDIHSAEYAAKVRDVETMGRQEITASSEVSNRLLDRPVKAMGSGVFNDKAPVAKGLIDLRHTVEDLNLPHQWDH
jgi:hypothetical protein